MPEQNIARSCYRFSQIQQVCGEALEAIEAWPGRGTEDSDGARMYGPLQAVLDVDTQLREEWQLVLGVARTMQGMLDGYLSQWEAYTRGVAANKMHSDSVAEQEAGQAMHGGSMYMSME